MFTSTSAIQVLRNPGGFWTARAVCQGRTLEFKARFLVDATGRSGSLHNALGARRKKVDHLVGIALTCPTIRADEPSPSLIEAHSLGWWYSAGLPTGATIAIFFTDSDLCSKMGLAKTERLQRVLSETRHTLRRVKSAHFPGTPRVFPAGSHCLQSASGDSWIAIGDAVIGRDPLSSSGIDFALASAQRAYAFICSLANGIQENVNKYDEQVGFDFQDYLAKRDAYYQIENRWPGSDFWRRRHESGFSRFGIKGSRRCISGTR